MIVIGLDIQEKLSIVMDEGSKWVNFNQPGSTAESNRLELQVNLLEGIAICEQWRRLGFLVPKLVSLSIQFFHIKVFQCQCFLFQFKFCFQCQFLLSDAKNTVTALAP